MSEHILVVDPGMMWTKAAIVADGESQMLKEPSSGSYCWPTAIAIDGEVLRVGTVAERRKRSDPSLYAGRIMWGSGKTLVIGRRRFPPHELLTPLLAALKEEAERLLGTAVGRVLMLAPDDRSPASTAGQVMIAAAAAAGFADVELLFLPAAVALPAAGSEPAPGLVLVCDAGASALRLTLVQTVPGRAGTPRARAVVPECGGDSLDALVVEAIRKKAKWLRPMLDAEGGAGERASIDLADLARRVRHEVTDAAAAEDTLTPVTPVITFTREELERIMRQPLAKLAAACKVLRGEAPGVGGIGRVVLAGGCARTPMIARALTTALACPVGTLPPMEFAALRGGCEWAKSAATRRMRATPVTVGLRGLTWDIPGGAGRLVGWDLTPGSGYGDGQSLAKVRDEGDAIWDLTAVSPGVLEQAFVADGAIVATADVLAVSRQTSVAPADRRPQPLRLAAVRGGQFAAFSQDSRQLATLDSDGLLRISDTESASELQNFRVGATVKPGMLAAATRPDGSWLAAFADNDAVVVAEVATGRRIARLAKGDGTRAVQLSGDGLYLCTGEAKRARIWENTGRELLSARDRPVSGEAVAMSRDGRLVAMVWRDGLAIWDRTTRKHQVIRPMRRFSGQVRQLAFSWDASRLLFAVDSCLELIALPSGVMLWGTDVPAPVLAAEFAPDDELIAVVSHPPGESSVWFRDAATGTEKDQISASAGPCGFAKFSPDGRFLVSSEGDNAVLWARAY
ncbi:MAG: Hsp70 family protein [Trebonia sp.]|jgi:WD40 repeat protein